MAVMSDLFSRICVWARSLSALSLASDAFIRLQYF